MTTSALWRTLLFPVLLPAFLAAPALADPTRLISGNELYDLCRKSDSDHVAEAFCVGYVNGVADMLPECADPTVTRFQIADVVTKYLKDHPKDRHTYAALHVIRAIGEAYECHDQAWADMLMGWAKRLKLLDEAPSE